MPRRRAKRRLSPGASSHMEIYFYGDNLQQKAVSGQLIASSRRRRVYIWLVTTPPRGGDDRVPSL